jgi:hypothetical protein
MHGSYDARHRGGSSGCCIWHVSRALNLLLVLVGLVVQGYGVLLCYEHPWVKTYMPLSLVVVGGYLAFFSSLYVVLGSRSTCFIVIYTFFMTVMVLAQVLCAMLLLFPAPRAQLRQFVSLDDLPQDHRAFLEKNVHAVVHAACALVIVEVLCIWLAQCVRKRLKFRSAYASIPDDADRRKALLSRHGGETVGMSLRDLEHYQNAHARHAQIYAKYGIKPSYGVDAPRGAVGVGVGGIGTSGGSGVPLSGMLRGYGSANRPIGGTGTLGGLMVGDNARG